MKGSRQGGYLVSRIHREGKKRFAELLRAHGVDLGPVRSRILFPLWREGRLPIHEIVKRTGLGKSTLTSLLDRLERDGHVRRVRSAEDRRVVLIEPVTREREGATAIVRVSAAMTALFYEGFTDGEIDRFERDLGRVLANLTRTPRKVSGAPE